MQAPWNQLTGDIDGYPGTITPRLSGSRPPWTDNHPEARFSDRVAAAAIKHYQLDALEFECLNCGAAFTSKRRDKLTCSERCKKALQRSGLKPKGTTGVGRAANRATLVSNDFIDTWFRLSLFDTNNEKGFYIPRNKPWPSSAEGTHGRMGVGHMPDYGSVLKGCRIEQKPERMTAWPGETNTTGDCIPHKRKP
jgi:hypothetical protein